LWLLESRDALGRDLLRRDVGVHCADEGCRDRRRSRRDDSPGHWHGQSWADLRNRHTLEALKARKLEAMTFVVGYCKEA